MLGAIAFSVGCINEYWKAREEKARQRFMARFHRELEAGLPSNRRGAAADAGNQVPAGSQPKLGKEERQKFVTATLKAMLKVLRDVTPPKRRTESLQVHERATSRSSRWQRTNWGRTTFALVGAEKRSGNAACL